MDYKYSISKRMEIAGAHQLSLGYESKCKNIHGHNWIVTVYCAANKLNQYGMVFDFKHVKEMIHDKLDHQFINEVIPGINPTAENMAQWIIDALNEVLSLEPDTDARCYRVDVQESEGNVACCTLDGSVL